MEKKGGILLNLNFHQKKNNVVTSKFVARLHLYSFIQLYLNFTFRQTEWANMDNDSNSLSFIQ